MKTRTFTALACGFAALLAGFANAQTPSFQWARRLASTANQDNELSIGLALDSATNIYVTGWFDGTNNFGDVTLTNSSGGGQDIFVARCNPAGALQWVRRAGGNSSARDGGRGIGVDDARNVYVTGEFVGDADFGAFNLSAPAKQEFFLVKYDTTGTVKWARQSVSAAGNNVYGTGLAVDAAGNTYAIGYADNHATITFETKTVLSPHVTGYSTFLVKYDNAGNAQWAQLLGGPGFTYATKVAVDDAGNIYVRGSFNQTATIGVSNLVSSVPGLSDMFLAKFNNSGALTWVQRSSGADVDEGGVAVDQAGNVFVTGWYMDNPITFDGITLTNAGWGDAFLAKYNSAGAIQWARRAGGTGLDFYWDVAADRQGGAYAAGFLSPDAVAPSGTGGAIVAKYDAAGILQWANSANGAPANPVASTAAKCAIDPAGNGYLVGWYQPSTAFGTTILPPQGYWNFFLTKVGFTQPTLQIGWSNSLPQLRVFGEISNRFALEFVPALPTSNNWQSFATNAIASPPLILTDTNAAGSSSRFYRARLIP
ncbi:MAG: SBBP repeat-containing protein [Verrucomicrobia subdivision 3 bacterium]|nr:SBBP repeat-containing protein [Limisphaerales bacterium]